MRVAVPWSVPAEAFESGVRPNSDSVMIVTRLRHSATSVCVEGADRGVEVAQQRGCTPGWSSWVSNPSSADVDAPAARCWR